MWMERTCGDLEHVCEALHELVPTEGRCEHSRSKNKALDKYRVACNLIHDLFNNGLGNRREHFRWFFGCMPIYTHSQVYKYGIREDEKYWNNAEDQIASKFRTIVMDAVLEQFGKDVWLLIMHNHSSTIISNAIKEGRIESAAL